MSHIANWLSFFVVGAIAGTLFDQIHVQFGVLSYPDPWLLGQSWCVAPNFGLATLLMWRGTMLIAPQIDKLEPQATGAEIIGDILWFTAAYVASGLLKLHSWPLLALYLIAFALRTFRRPGRNWLWLHGLGLALGGCTVEMLLVHFGKFRYEHPDIGGIAYWLPGLYLHLAPMAMAASRRLRPDNR